MRLVRCPQIWTRQRAQRRAQRPTFCSRRDDSTSSKTRFNALLCLCRQRNPARDAPRRAWAPLHPPSHPALHSHILHNSTISRGQHVRACVAHSRERTSADSSPTSHHNAIRNHLMSDVLSSSSPFALASASSKSSNFRTLNLPVAIGKPRTQIRGRRPQIAPQHAGGSIARLSRGSCWHN